MKGYEDAEGIAKRIGEWVFITRRRKGYTRDDLAKLSGVSKYTIRSLELPSVKQEYGPHVEVLVAILEALGVNDPIGRMLPPLDKDDK